MKLLSKLNSYLSKIDRLLLITLRMRQVIKTLETQPNNTSAIKRYQAIRYKIGKLIVRRPSVISLLYSNSHFIIFISVKYKDIELSKKEAAVIPAWMPGPGRQGRYVSHPCAPDPGIQAGMTDVFASDAIMPSLPERPLEAKDNNDYKEFQTHLLLHMLYFNPWTHLDPTQLFDKIHLFLDEYTQTWDMLPLLFAYIFNFRIVYSKIQEAEQHSLFMTKFLNSLILFYKNLNSASQKKVLELFKKSYKGSMLACNSHFLKEFRESVNFFILESIKEKHEHLIKNRMSYPVPHFKIKLGLLRYNYANEINLFMEIFTLLSNKFEIHVFAINETGLEEIKTRFSQRPIFYHPIPSDNLEQAISYVRSQEIDIAINASPISGSAFYAGVSIPMLLNIRIAPTQIMYFSDILTSGIKNVDYYFIGSHYYSLGMEYQFTEKLKLVEGLNHHIKTQTPDFNHRMILRQQLNISDQDIVFISNSHLFKLTPDLLLTWLQVLNTVENSKLILMPFAESDMFRFERSFQTVLKKLCAEQNVDYHRIIILPIQGAQNIINALTAGDIHFDSFPYSSPSSAHEALVAGLPIVTLQKESYRSCFVAGLLKELDLAHFIAQSEEEYINIAKQFATFAAFRQEFQAQAQAKIPNLTQASSIVKNLEKALLSVYRDSKKLETSVELQHESVE